MKVLVTGSKGFVGKNLCALLRRRDDVELFEYNRECAPAELHVALNQADCVVHLAGVNRPEHPDEFETGNAGSLEDVCERLESIGRTCKIVLSSSVQAELSNPYGISKRHAEESLKLFSEKTRAECVVFRLNNLFGKWCRPNYNSVTATFCHNVANGIPINISDPSHEIDLTHIDNVLEGFMAELPSRSPGFRYADALPSRRISLKELANKIKSYGKMRSTLGLPDFRDPFDRALYSTYLSYMDARQFGYDLSIHSDNRGALAEFIKSPAMGQIFVSHTKPGVTRGNHFHHTKVEKFLVLRGEATIRLRHIDSDEIVEYSVNGKDFSVIDIPPGYTHAIKNIGEDELVTLFWACEVFDTEKPDTFFEEVSPSF